ncbi:unnamed protein product [Didymodactylos carnosus]|uniref:Uncharacterized protein n=1 Tax=Didymodactylos carnosus TaxID=1234261 RepID=A0A814L0J7_9BILA|nr:unnamed protein product [Didymodactylos carnosus]CAF1058262.1 unnamed protein product [Didymodactylos carnosus]CAF3635019.1 unnamed protein product [Didymodactylos carnosus]CAF3826994.1 unnamed protein product [Didymodactylos carnosus]
MAKDEKYLIRASTILDVNDPQPGEQQQGDEQDEFLKHLVSKHQRLIHHSSNVSTPLSSVTPITAILELKNRRSIAEVERKKRIIAKIVSIVGLLIILLCAAIVTLTLKMAPKIDELVRKKSGNNLMYFPSSRTSTTKTTSTFTINELLTTSNLTNITSTYQYSQNRRRSRR